MQSQSIQELMTSDPRVCIPTDGIFKVARIMRDINCGALPVVDGPDTRRLMGMITDRDIVCRVVAEGTDPSRVAVRDVMSREITCIPENGTVDQCVRLMSVRQVRRLPVVDANGRVVGIVAQADLAGAAKQQGDLEDELAEVLEEVSEPATTARAD